MNPVKTKKPIVYRTIGFFIKLELNYFNVFKEAVA